MEEDRLAISKLPQVNIVGKQMSSFTRFMNLAYGKSSVLKRFNYNAGIVTFQMESGKSITSPLSDLTVRFDKTEGILYFEIKNSKRQKIKFHKTSNFTNDQWDVIINILCLCPNTYGKDLFGKTSKTLGNINTVLKIIKHLN